MNATREKTRLWLLILVGVVATLLGQTHAREIFAPSPPASGIFAAQTQASTGENYDACRYDTPDSLLAAERGYISGSYSELRGKALAARGGDVGAMGEIDAAKLLRSEGTNVHFQTPIGPRGPNTADFLVGGQRGTGLGGAPTDVFTPITSKPGNIISGIANKNNQAPNILLNLQHTPVTGSQLGNVLDRLHNGFGATNIQSVRIIE